jgi:hypothetical protein
MYYLYRHIRLDKNEPFYVGIGTKHKDAGTHRQEYYRSYIFNGRTKAWKNIAKKGYKIEILYESDSKNIICEKEKEFIKIYRLKIDGGILYNFTYGGEHTKLNSEMKLSISKRMKGNKNGLNKKMSKESKDNLSHIKKEYYKTHESWCKGKNFDVLFKNKISNSKKGVLLSESHKLALIGTRPHQKKVKCINTDITYNSICECVRSMFGWKRSIKNDISKICNNKKDNYKGFKFKFV